jgi:signal transduction histidine kinase
LNADPRRPGRWLGVLLGPLLVPFLVPFLGPLRVVVLSALCLGLVIPALASAQAAAPLLLELPHAELQAAGQGPQTVTLPYRIYRDQRVFTRYRLVLRFDAAAALVQQRSMLALDSWPDGGRITLNGAEVADIATSTEAQVARHLRPFAFSLPPGALRDVANELVFEWGSRETLVLMPLPTIGPRELLEPLMARKLFWEHTIVPGSTVFALVIGLVMLSVGWQLRRRGPWLRRPAGRTPVTAPGSPAEHDYLLIGSTALGWVIFNTMLLWSPLPAELFVWRRTVGYLGVGLFAMGMWVSLTRLAGWRTRHSRRFETLCWTWIALGPALSMGGFLLTGATHVPRTESLWAVGGALLGLVPMVAVIRAAWRQPSARLCLLVGFVLVAVGLTVREALVYVFRDPIGTLRPGLQLLSPLWLALASGILVQDFVQSLRAASQERAAVDRRLAEREAELARLHAREREHATVEERQRIMQDMHDGLGSQLVSSLALAERGALSAPQTAEMLRGCIDDLRLALDTLTDADVDLALTAGNLRFRMEPRLRAAGLRVRWDMQGLPDELRMPGTTALPVLRVLQESLANAVKHAGAHSIQVLLAVQAEGAVPTLALDVVDDGTGFDLDHHASGKGLASMRKRARALGAQLSVASSTQGTCVRLRLPLPAGPTAAAP